MSLANWPRFAVLLLVLTACARSSSIDDEGFVIDDDEDAGLVGTDDRDGGGGGSGDASVDAGLPGNDGGSDLDGGSDADTDHPCSGVSCHEPPPNVCADAQKLRVYEPVGVCDDGECHYESTIHECATYCAHGACADDPCAGVSCNTPPGNACKDENTAIHYAQTGTCSGGTCTYTQTEVPCPYGCENGFCKDCSIDDDCGVGKYCNAGVCASCNNDVHCGDSCTNCSASGRICHAGSCVECTIDSQCGPGEICDVATGACKPPCSPTGQSVFSDAFGSPNTSSWTTGTDVAVSTSRWRAFTNAKHGVRVYNGRLEITNKTSGSPAHGHGYAYVKTGGAGSAYDNAHYDPVLSANAGREVVWTLNMRRSNPSAESTNGGFDCTSTSSQNRRTVGLAYVLATDSAEGLNASAGTCNPSSTGSGYAVVVGGNTRVRLVRFTNGLRNGTITNIVESSSFSRVSDYFSVRVTFNANTHQWKLEARSDGESSFKDPATGSYSFTGTNYDSTYVDVPLEYSGPYFQTGCALLCKETFDAYFDNVNVATRCAP